MSETFTAHLDWSGAAKGPARDPSSFSRDLQVSFGDTALPMSSAPGYRGNASRVNPEQLLVASLSACQALTYLFLAARAGVVVTAYSDDGEGELSVVDGKTRMARVTLRPHIVLETGADGRKAHELVEKAHHACFISNSLLTRVELEPTIEFTAD